MDSNNFYEAKVAQGNTQPFVRITQLGSMPDAPRMIFDDVDGWVNVEKTGTFKDAGSNDPGIFTRGQFICIGVTIIDMAPNSSDWTKARMAHVSSKFASLICKEDSTYYDGFRDVDGDNLYAQITSKESMGSMSNLVDCLQKALPQLRGDHIWLYTANVAPKNMSAAVSKQAFFGEPPDQ